MEHLSRLEVEFESHLAFHVGDPLAVAGLKGTVFVRIGWESVECGPGVALFVLLEVATDVIPHEAVEQIELEIVLHVERLALLSLLEVVVIVLVAFVGQRAQQLLLSLETKLCQDAFFEVQLHALDCVLHLQEGLWLEAPWGSGGLEGVEGLGLVLHEIF